MDLIFTPDDSGMDRGTGYAIIPYSTDAEKEMVIETTVDALSTIFKEAQAGGGTLGGVEASIDAAIDAPLLYLDFLVLEDGEIAFDDEYSRLQGKT